MTQWFADNKDAISGLSDFAGMIALFATAIALGITAYQVYRNIAFNKAKAIYEIHRDARETTTSIFSDPVVYKGIFGVELDDGAKVRSAWGQVFNFYAAVYQQWRLDVIDDRLWEQFEREINQFLIQDDGRERWLAVKDYHEADYRQHLDSLLAKIDESPQRQEGGDNGRTVEHTGP